MNMYRMAGMAIGIIVGIVICVILFKVLNKDKNVKTKYDERQEMIRNKSYKYAFYTVVFYEALMLCLSIGGFPAIPVPQYVFHMLGVFLGLGVVIVYSILKEAYWGQNNNVKSYVIVMIACFVINILPLVGTLRSGVEFVDGYWDFPYLNLMCSVLLLVVGITGAIKHFADAKSEAED